MSRIGKQSIEIPSGVEVNVDGLHVTVKSGAKTLDVKMPRGIKAEVKENRIVVSPVQKEKKSISAFWGLSRALIANAVKGVSSGFEKILEFKGVGYKAVVKGNSLELHLGYSHSLSVEAPEGVAFKVEKNVITVSGFDKQAVGETAARIRRLRKPEPYKGSGIKYQDERIIRKAGKRAIGTGA